MGRISAVLPIRRAFWVVAHRWAGLTIAFFLCVAGLTGSLIAWNHELDELFAPALFQTDPPEAGARPLDPLALRARAEALTGARIDRAPLHWEEGEAVQYYPAAAPGQPTLAYNQIGLDPYTGKETARRQRGALTEGRHNIMPFVYRLHYELALGRWMYLAFGIAALIWTLDCFVGFFLTLPAGASRRWSRWRKAWQVRTPVRSRYRLNVDLHTAGGLWLWPVLLVFAWSAVGFNLREEVYNPVMTAVTGKPDMFSAIEKPAVPNQAQRLSWPAALAEGRAHAAALAARHGFRIEREGVLIFNRPNALWQYRVRSDRDLWGRYESTRILFSDRDGSLVNFQIPSGHHARETVDNWTFGLHMGLIGGLPYRIFVTILGLAVTGLSMTGVIIWMRKRSARLLSRQRRVPPPHLLQPAE